MAQIVINISDGTYNRCKNERVGLLPFDIPEVCDAIKNGTTLPKGHGRLIDADKLKEQAIEVKLENVARDIRVIARRQIEESPTIIEADKEDGGNDGQPKKTD